MPISGVGRPRRTLLIRLLPLGLVTMLFTLLAACSGDGSSTNGSPPDDPSNPSDGERIAIVTTTTFLADWAQEIGGDRVHVFSLVPIGSDPHGFQPGARDVARVAEADLVLSIGASLEGAWLTELVTNAAASESRVIEVAEGLELLPFGEGAEQDEGDDESDHEDEEDEHGGLDPHFWFDPVLVQSVIDDMADRLSAIDSAGAAVYQANAAAYKAEIDELDAWIREQTATIAEEDRLLVTSHDSLGYLARRYGFTVVGTVLGGGTAESEPSAEELAQLTDLVNEHSVRAVFGESTVTERLAASVAEESGAELVRLYSGSLGPEGSGADTWLGMMRINFQRIVDGLT